MDPYISRAGGYLSNPDSTSDCRFCSFRTTDEFLDLSFNIKYSHRWRDVGIFIAFIIFNVSDHLIFFQISFVDWCPLDCFDLSLHLLVPDEAMGSVQVVQLEEEVDSST